MDEHVKAYRDKTALIGIVGLGYVGIPLALAASNAGFKVLGFDIDSERVASINKGDSQIKHIPSSLLGGAVESGMLEATDDFARLGEPDALLIAVPTPLTRYREPDMTYVCRTAEAIAKVLRKGQTIILESTTYPGTSDELIKPTLERSGLKCGVDFFLAYSPEREDPGNVNFTTSSIPKVVSGDGPVALEIAEELYGHLVETVVPVSSMATAEAVKLTENIYRAVNIALVNELKVVYAAMGIDVWEVIDAAATKPFGFTPFYPGPGLGGHCIPIDPFYLTWKAREYDISTRFIELAGEVNTRMPYYVVEQLVDVLDKVGGRRLSDARILVLGIAYKKNVDDMRESPSLKLIELLEKRNAKVDYHDSYFPVVPRTRDHPTLTGRRSVELSAQSLASYDAVLVATDHDDIDYEMVAGKASLVLDTRNALAKRGLNGANIHKA